MDIRLPEYEGLSVYEFSSLFDNMSESYKLFWFGSIMDWVGQGRQEMSFREIIGGMVTSAWYMVSEFHLNLGPLDTLEKLVLRLRAISGMLPNTKPEEIIDSLNQTDDPTVREYLRTLTLNVPYRLQAPFLRESPVDDWNRPQVMRETFRMNDRLIYTMNEERGLDRKIHIRDNWYTYLRINQMIIRGWIESELIHYLQKRNPTVPGISEKLRAPSERDLKRAKEFWSSVIEGTQIINIYSPEKEVLTPGGLSIDHFVPWSYVTHDELWNLTPTTRPLNSSKGNRLPDWELLFWDFAHVQYEAYQARWNDFPVSRIFEKNKGDLVNSREALSELYDQQNLPEPDFMTRLEHLIRPTWQAAKEQGFQIWHSGL